MNSELIKKILVGIPVLIGVAVAGLLHIKAKNARSIAFFGSKGSGKTTIWKQLKGEFQDKKYQATVEKETINEFTIELNGKKKTIKKSADYPGEDEWVKRYGEIINDKTFIYYLIDLTRLEENRQETRSRLQAIGKVLEDHKIKKYGITLVGTNFTKYQNETGFDKSKAKKQLVETISPGDIKGVMVEDEILIAELTDKNDVKQIMNQIIG